eukprot:12938491-Prorocentrum_lima.AAC.1
MEPLMSCSSMRADCTQGFARSKRATGRRPDTRLFVYVPVCLSVFFFFPHTSPMRGEASGGALCK